MTRRVRTPEGVKRFHGGIGTVIDGGDNGDSVGSPVRARLAAPDSKESMRAAKSAKVASVKAKQDKAIEKRVKQWHKEKRQKIKKQHESLSTESERRAALLMLITEEDQKSKDKLVHPTTEKEAKKRKLKQERKDWAAANPEKAAKLEEKRRKVEAKGGGKYGTTWETQALMEALERGTRHSPKKKQKRRDKELRRSVAALEALFGGELTEIIASGRRVRTPEGVKKFGGSIGSLITAKRRKHQEHRQHVKARLAHFQKRLIGEKPEPAPHIDLDTSREMARKRSAARRAEHQARNSAKPPTVQTKEEMRREREKVLAKIDAHNARMKRREQPVSLAEPSKPPKPKPSPYEGRDPSTMTREEMRKEREHFLAQIARHNKWVEENDIDWRQYDIVERGKRHKEIERADPLNRLNNRASAPMEPDRSHLGINQQIALKEREEVLKRLGLRQHGRR